MSYLDKTFCASPNCKNECGRKMTEEQKTYAQRQENLMVSYAYFCDENGDLIENGDKEIK